MEESRSSTSVHSSSRDDSDVETALSFDLSQMNTVDESFDYDELIDLMDINRSRREGKDEEGTHEINAEMVNLLEESSEELDTSLSSLEDLLLDQDFLLLPIHHSISMNVEMARQLEEESEELDMSNSDSSVCTLEDLLLDQDHLLPIHHSTPVISARECPLLPVLHSTPVIPAREPRTYVNIQPISDALIPGGRRVRSFSAAYTVFQSRSDTSIERETFESNYSSTAVSESAVATPEQTRLSYESEYGTSVTASQESVMNDEKVEWSTVPADITVSFGDEKHGIKMEIGISMTLDAPGGPPVISTVIVPN